MSNLLEFSKILSDVHLGGIINECVINVNDNVASIIAVDETVSVAVQTSAPFEVEDGLLGIGNLALLNKYISTIKSISEVSIQVQDTTLNVKPKKGPKVKYLLSETDLVITYDPEWEADANIIEDELENGEYGNPVKLVQAYVGAVVDMMNTFSPNSVYVNVDGKGNVKVHGGKDSEHQFDMGLGKIKGASKFSIKVYGDNIRAVLNSVDYNQEPVMYLAEDSPIIIKTKTSDWLLRPIEEVASE